MRHREAEAVLHDLLDRHGPNHAVLCNLANVNIALGLQDKAVEFAQKAIHLDPGAMMPRRDDVQHLAISRRHNRLRP